MNTNNIQLGDEVRDTITGFSGVAYSLSQYVHGCSRVGIQSRKLKEGKPLPMEWFDVQQVEIITKKPTQTLPSGGPQQNPTQGF